MKFRVTGPSPQAVWSGLLCQPGLKRLLRQMLCHLLRSLPLVALVEVDPRVGLVRRHWHPVRGKGLSVRRGARRTKVLSGRFGKTCGIRNRPSIEPEEFPNEDERATLIEDED